MNRKKLIDPSTMWDCKTCFYDSGNGCTTFCDAGEGYRPAYSKFEFYEIDLDDMTRIIHEPTRSEFKRMAIQLGYKPIVYCKDCKHWHRCMSDDGKTEFVNGSLCLKGVRAGDGREFFCAYGEVSE